MHSIWCFSDSIYRRQWKQNTNINMDAWCVRGQHVCVCLWTVNTALGLCDLNGVRGPSERRSPGFFKWDFCRYKTCKKWFAAFEGGFIFLLISSLFKYQEQFYFSLLLLTASYCNPLSYVKCHFISFLLRGWSIFRHIYVTTRIATDLQDISVIHGGAIKICFTFLVYDDVWPYMGQKMRQRS